MDVESNITADSVKTVADEMRETIAELEALDSEERVSSITDMRVLARGIKLTLVALTSSIGECQRDVPYSPMHPVSKPDGTFSWCCNHDPEHCS